MKPGSNNQVIRKRDFCVLAIIILAIYISLEKTSYDFRLDPAWFFDQRKDSNLHWGSVLPIITDLDGDGSKELVVITKDLTLKVLSTENPDKLLENIYYPTEIASISLTKYLINNGHRPVALKTGYVDAYEENRVRKQVIIVVREDWTVLCFTSTLEPLWEKSIFHKSHEMTDFVDKFTIQDISIFLTPINVANGTSGMVVVGASMGLKEGVDVEEESVEVKHDLGVSTPVGHKKGHPKNIDLELRATLEHYSVYALDAHDGSIVWQHDGSEVRAEQYTRSLPQHMYKMEARDLSKQSHHGIGVHDWLTFRQSLLAELPHNWHNKDDSFSRLAHFVRRHVGAGPDAVSQNVKKSKVVRKVPVPVPEGRSQHRQTGDAVKGKRRFTGVETPALPATADLPHDASEHTVNPNVIVAHTRRGVEVIGLRSGLPITSLALAPDATYADVDGDSVVDTIIVLENEEDASRHGEAFAHEGGQFMPCTLMVVSGLPARTQLFNGSICQRTVSLHDPIARSRFQLQDHISAAPPVVLRNLHGKESAVKDAHVREIVVGISAGIVSCYSGKGELRWQINNAPTWSLEPSEGSASHASVSLFDWNAHRVEEHGTHDSRHSQIVVVGDSKVSIITRDGTLQATSAIPRPPISKPIFGDFDGDGITDIVIMTEDALLGLRVEVTASPRGMLIAVLVLVVLAGVVFMANIKSEVISEGGGGGAGAVTTKKILSIVRSTDDYHID